MSKLEVIKNLSLIYFFHSPLLWGQSNIEWEKQANKAISNFESYEEIENENFIQLKNRILEKWNEALMPEKKVYVKYFEDDKTRAVIDYETGLVVVETIQIQNNRSEISAKESIEKALNTLVDNKYSVDSIIVKNEIVNPCKIVEKIVNDLTQKIEKKEELKGRDLVKRDHYQLTFKLVPNFIKLRAEKLRPSIKVWAKKYNLEPSFILAIIRQESAFNPRAKSRVGAIGLMQIMPQFAGTEVMKAVTGKQRRPSIETLYDPIQNIMFGATYLQIIRDKYFPEIREPSKKTYIMTASYNWGPQRIKSAINKNKLSLSATSEEVLERLLQISPAETQEYLRKVKIYTEEFRGI